MKPFYYLLLLVCSASFGQIYFPDPALKAALMSPNHAYDWLYNDIENIDQNGDGEIDFDEASQVVELDISNKGISDLTGIEVFVNLEQLMAAHNQIGSCQLQGMPSLRYLDVGNNGMSILDVSYLDALENITFAQNPLITIDLSNCLQLENVIYSGAELMGFRAAFCPNLNSVSLTCPNLFDLDLEGSAIAALMVWSSSLSSMTLENLSNLTSVTFQGNPQLTDFTVSNCPSLTYLNLFMCNQLQTVNISGTPALAALRISDNQVAELDVSELTSLTLLTCISTQVSSLDLSGLTSLTDLDVSGNLLTELDVSNLTQLALFGCNFNQLTSLDVSNLTNLVYLDCGHNQLTTLDLSNQTSLQSLYASNNQLETLFIKNGRVENLDLEGNPNLAFVCADDSQIIEVQNELNGAGITGALVNSYCSFVPGGDYNTITGTVRFDADANGCDASDPVHPLVKIAITDGMENGATFTATDGTYNFYTGAGNFDVVPQLENPSYFNVVPIASASFPDVDNSVETRDFCIVPNGIHRDLEVVIAPVVAARPGFEAVYKIVYRNKGNQTISMSLGLDFSYNPDLMAFTSATTAPDSAGPGLLQWNYSGLQPFESRSILVTMQINPPTHPTNPVNIDDELTFTALVEMMGADDMPQDNVFQLVQTVVGSYDPNNMICLEGDTVPVSSIGEYLHYITNFENTGTDYAENVVVKIEFDDMNFDLNSLQLMDSSDPVYARITGNKVEYIFEGIYLGIGGHGNILLKIRTNFGLSAGDMVANNADIYFDYNHPVVTDMASTLFQSLQTPGYIRDASVVVYPNPSSGMVNVKSASSVTKVELFDTHGRLLQMKIGGMADGSLDMSSRAKGIYFLRITTSDGIHIEKLIRD
jgi:Leucine-rich repeat (LRR) protein